MSVTTAGAFNLFDFGVKLSRNKTAIWAACDSLFGSPSRGSFPSCLVCFELRRLQLASDPSALSQFYFELSTFEIYTTMCQ